MLNSRPIIRTKIFNCKRKININNLTINMIECISEFLTIPDLFQLRKINKRLKIFVKKSSKMFIKFIKLKIYCKQENLNLEDLLKNDSYFLQLIQIEMNKKNFSIHQISHMIFHLLLTSTKGTELIIESAGKWTLNYFKMIMTSIKCPYESIFIKKLFYDKNHNIINNLSIALTHNKNI